MVPLSVWKACISIQLAEEAAALEAMLRRFGSGATRTPPPEVTGVMAAAAEALRTTSPFMEGMVVAVATGMEATVAAGL